MIFFRLSGADSVPAERPTPDEDEDIEPRTFSLAEAREMVRRGEIIDMKTVVGLTLSDDDRSSRNREASTLFSY